MELHRISQTHSHNPLEVPRRPKVVAVSHACIRSTNREVYRSLRRMGYDISLLIANGITVENGEFHSAEPLLADDPPARFVATRGKNLRLLRYETFSTVLDEESPQIVFVEADPASLLAMEAAIWCRRHKARLICRTNENLSWHPIDAFKRAGLKDTTGRRETAGTQPYSVKRCSSLHFERGSQTPVRTTGL